MPKPKRAEATKADIASRNIVGIGPEKVTNYTSQDVPGIFYSEDSNWSLDAFRQHVRVSFHRNAPYEAVFSLIGVDASLANALRRILLSEIPSLAIDQVFISQNTSVIQDEVLAHRLGLVPLKGDREGVRWLQMKLPEDEEKAIPAETEMDFNTVVLELKVECSWQDKGRQRADKGETDPELLYNQSSVYASDLIFRPQGQQETRFASPGEITSTNPDILLAKLRPPQQISLMAYATKGIGREHAKYSPVATASYRLLPVIDIRAPILGAEAEKFQRCFPPGVIGIETVSAADVSKDGALKGHEGESRAVVKEAIRDTMSRECLRHDEFKDKVKLGRQRDHFIFSVESVGQYESDELFLDAIKVLKGKCVDLKRCVAELRNSG